MEYLEKSLSHNCIQKANKNVMHISKNSTKLPVCRKKKTQFNENEVDYTLLYSNCKERVVKMVN